MADILVTSPYRPFTLPNQFKAVFNGSIYCGTVDAVDPSNSQVQVYKVNEDGSRIPVAQPLRTNAGGYLVYNGQPAKFVTDSNHSLLVQDSLHAQVWYAPDMSVVDPSSAIDFIFEEIAGNGGASLIGSANGDTVQDYIDNCEFVPSFQHLVGLASVRAEVGRIKTQHYYNSLPEFAWHTQYAGNEFVRSGTGTPGDTDGGSYVVLADGSKWVSTLPIHVDRFGAVGGVAPVNFDSGPAFQKAVIAVGKSLYASSGQIQMDGPVYRIETKVLWPSNVTFKGNQTTILSAGAGPIFESGYFNAGVLTSNWALSDNDVIANGIVTDSRFLNAMFIGVANVFRLKGFTIGCAIGSENKCVTFSNCGTAVDAELSFYSAFRFFVRGDHATAVGQYATRFGHQCNLNTINITYADRVYGTTLSEPVSAARPSANMQVPDFSGSSFEGITGVGVLLRGTTYGVKLDNIYAESVATLVGKDTGNFKTYEMSLNHKSWNFGVTKLISIAGAKDIKLAVSNESGDYPSLEFVSAPGLENTGEVELSGKFGLSASKFILDVHDDIKLNFRYDFRGSEVTYTSPEAYVIIPNVGNQQFNYTLNVFSGINSIVKSGIGSIHGVTGLGGSNAYVTQNPDGSLILHFTTLNVATYPWLASATFIVSVWS